MRSKTIALSLIFILSCKPKPDAVKTADNGQEKKIDQPQKGDGSTPANSSNANGSPSNNPGSNSNSGTPISATDTKWCSDLGQKWKFDNGKCSDGKSTFQIKQITPASSDTRLKVSMFAISLVPNAGGSHAGKTSWQIKVKLKNVSVKPLEMRALVDSKVDFIDSTKSPNTCSIGSPTDLITGKIYAIAVDQEIELSALNLSGACNFETTLWGPSSYARVLAQIKNESTTIEVGPDRIN